MKIINFKLMLFFLLSDHPKYRDDSLVCKYKGFNPDVVIKIDPLDPYNCIEELPNVLDEMQVAFKRKYKILKSFYLNNYNICHKIRNLMKNIDLPEEEKVFGWCLRCVLIGRRGSGRKVQAAILAHVQNLVLINVEDLIQQAAHWDDYLGEIIRRGIKEHEYSPEAVASILLKRLLMPDCLSNGWIIIGYPNTIFDMQWLLSDKFIAAPNKIIFLHTRERVCWRRLSKKMDGHLRYENDFIQQEMDYYNLYIRDILAATKGFTGVIHINGNHSISTVSTNLLSRVNQIQRL